MVRLLEVEQVEVVGGLDEDLAVHNPGALVWAAVVHLHRLIQRLLEQQLEDSVAQKYLRLAYKNEKVVAHGNTVYEIILIHQGGVEIIIGSVT